MGLSGIRWALTFLIVVMAVFIGHRVRTHMQAKEPPSPPSSESINPADSWIQGFTYRQTQSGVTKWEVVAKRAQVFEAQHRAQLIDVTVHLFREKDKEMTVVAEEGSLNTKTNNFELQNQEDLIEVRLSSGYTILSQQLQWVDASHEIKTNTPVIIKGKGVTITGTGLVGNVDDEEFRILQDVKAKVSL